MPDRAPGKEPQKITTNRIILWIVVAGLGLYLVITGIVGIVAKG